MIGSDRRDTRIHSDPPERVGNRYARLTRTPVFGRVGETRGAGPGVTTCPYLRKSGTSRSSSSGRDGTDTGMGRTGATGTTDGAGVTTGGAGGGCPLPCPLPFAAGSRTHGGGVGSRTPAGG